MMTLNEYLQLGGSVDALINVLDEFLLMHDETDYKNFKTLGCSDDNETFALLMLLEDYSAMPFGFELRKYIDRKDWNQIYLSDGAIHFGMRPGDETVMLSDFLERCLLPQEKRADEADRLDIAELPDIMELLC